jgi:hypothetical protein
METTQKPVDTDLAGVVEDKPGNYSATPGDAAMVRWRRSGFPIDIPVLLYAHEESKSVSYSEGKTVCVHANGALVAVTEVFEIGQWVLLINSNTEQEFICQVRLVHECGTGINYAGVEFAAASIKFWGDIFPLNDWDTDAPEVTQDPLPTIAAPLKPLDSGSSCEPEASATAAQSKGVVVEAAKVGTPARFAKSDLRRSARLSAQIPVAIHALEKDKGPSYVKGETTIISANGAVLAVSAKPNIGLLLHLTNLNTGKAMVCKVRSVREDRTGVNLVAIELAAAAPNFWGVTFSHSDQDPGKR